MEIIIENEGRKLNDIEFKNIVESFAKSFDPEVQKQIDKLDKQIYITEEKLSRQKELIAKSKDLKDMMIKENDELDNRIFLLKSQILQKLGGDL